MVNTVAALVQTPVYAAARKGHHAEEVDVLMRAKADVNTADDGGATPIYVAARNGHFGAVQALLRAEGADVDLAKTPRGGTPAFAAARSGFL